MTLTFVNSHDAPDVAASFSQAVLVEGARCLLFVSGQVGETRDGEVPEGLEEQLELAFGNVRRQLEAAQMHMGHIVKLTTLISSREQLPALRAARMRALGDHRPAITAMVALPVNPRWLVEVEAIAAV